MGKREWSANQLRIIQERGKNIMVSAAAGAGKTSVLVERIFTLITDPKLNIDIDRLLIMTFTKDAAGEMRERIIARLDDALVADPSDKRLRRQKMLAHNARIVTIDSFCNSLVKEFYYLIDLDPAYRIGETPEITLISKTVLEDVLEDQFDKNDQAFLKLVECFSDKKNDRNIEKLIERLYSAASSAPDPIKWLKALKGEYHPEGDIDSLEWMRFLKRHSDELLNEMLAGMKHALALICDDTRYEKVKALLTEEIRLYQNVLDCSTYGERYDIISSAKFGRMNRPKDIENEMEFWEHRIQETRNAAKAQFNDILKGKLYVQSAESVPGMLLGMSEPLDRLIDITCEYYDRLLEKKMGKGVFDFNDIAHFALQILEKDEARLCCRERYREVFVDEYQDSNAIQESLAEAITGEQGVMPFLFTVGDVKQSIYRFRMAKPKLFTDRFISYRDFPDRGTDIVLDRNYRSYPLVLASTNDVFFLSMNNEPGGIKYDDEASLKAGLPCHPEEGFENRTEVLLVNSFRDDPDAEEDVDPGEESGEGADKDNESEETVNSNNELEAEAVACEIVRLIESGYTVEYSEGRRPLLYSDITLLFRKKTHMETFKKVFEKQDIPVYMQGRGGFYSSFEVRTVMNFLSLLDNPRQDIALAGALHSPLFGLSSQELSEIRVCADISYDFYDALCTYRECGNNKALSAKVERFFTIFNEIRAMNLSRDIDRVIAAVINKTGFDDFCSKLPNAAKRKMNLELLLAGAEKYEISSYSGLFSFVHYVDKMIENGINTEEAAAPVGINAVRFTTMHSSKGLEFPVVFVVGCCSRFDDKETKPRDVTDLIVSPEFGIASKFIDLEERYKKDTVWMTVTKARMHNEFLGEEMRLLYVAMTRARQKLYLTGCTKLKKGFDKNGKPVSSRLDDWNRMIERLENGEKVYPYSYLTWMGMFMDLIYPAAMTHGSEFVVRGLSASEVEAAFGEYADRAKVKVNGEGKAASESGKAEDSKLPAESGEVKDSKSLSESGEVEDSRIESESEKPLPIKLSVSAVKKASMLDYEAELGESVELARIPRTLVKEAGDEPEAVSESAAGVAENVTGGVAGDVAGGTVGVAENVTSGTTGESSEKITGALLGTLYHKLCRLIPYALEPEKVGEFLDTLAEKAIISVEEKNAVNCGKLERFLKSKLAGRMAIADAAGQLKREQPFVQGFPAEELLTEFEGRKEIIPVQGVIDCFFYEAAERTGTVAEADMGNSGGWVLVDYKTDFARIGDEPKLVERYRKQFELYKAALESVSGVKVKEMILYSFSLGKAIPIT